MFDRTGRPIDPEIRGGTREEALRIAALGPNAPGVFRMWQEKGGPEEKMNRMGIEGSKEDVPLVEEEAEEDDVRITVRDTFDRMEDLVNKMQRLQLRLQGICEEAGKEGVGCPKVFTMGRGGSGDGPNEPNPRMLRANMAAKISGGQRSVRGTIPFATRRPAGGNPQKEQAQASQPAEEEPPITVKGDEDEDEKIREEEERQAKIRAKRRKGEAKEGRSKRDMAPSKKRKYQTSIEEGVDLEGLVNKLLEGHNELLNLKEILASAPKFREMVKARLSRRRVASVRMGDLIPKEANWSVAGSKMDWKFVGTGSIDVMIKGKMCPGMVDTGAEMNIVNGETTVKLGLEVNENDCGFLNEASGKTGYTGVASNVVIEIGRVKRMREGIQNGPCRINDETEKKLIIGEPGFLTRQEEDLVKELIREKHGAYAFNDDQRGRLDVDKIEMIRIHTAPHEPWNARGAKYPNPEDRRRVVEYQNGKIRTDVAGYSSGPYASPWFCFVKPNGVLRWVKDLQRLNAVTVRDAGGLPDADQLSEACAARQDQRKKERLQKKGLWIGREVTEPQGNEEENEEEDNVPLKKLKNKARVSPKSSSKESERAEGDEQEEEEAAEDRRRSMGTSMVPRKKKLGKKRAIESGRKEVQERVSEEGEGVEEVEEGKKVQGGGKAPKFKRTKEKRPIGDKEETSEIGKKEDEKDGQVEKLMRDMEEMRKEVRELKKEKEELQKEMSQLRVTLNVWSRELEEEVATRGKIEIRVGGLVSEVSVLGQDLDNEISERKKLGREWEKRWGEILKGIEGLRLSEQGKEKKATKMVGRKWGEEKGVQTEGKREESPAPDREVSESVAMPLPGQGKRQRESQLDSPKVAEDQAETSIQPDISLPCANVSMRMQVAWLNAIRTVGPFSPFRHTTDPRLLRASRMCMHIA
ncbi:hypothetical protein CBR_g25953 [Chara braunii]|uniref:Peptidase A2 domain-containing protein n=1 Tax=Chara braunii TaxID=69332 RepID=A0A388L6T9_CHABU|nr:hypothetical protein CBR_g25953 [Chara braunii]|eukprot:GBG78019.1 hypothetical protein CBR_g25953 [Chara braunii]